MSDFEYIRAKVPANELLAQLAEECAELARAALELRRVNNGKNPAPTKTVQEVYQNLREELADVNVCVRALRWSFADDDVMEAFAAKRTLWRKRLEAMHED